MMMISMVLRPTAVERTRPPSPRIIRKRFIPIRGTLSVHLERGRVARTQFRIVGAVAVSALYLTGPTLGSRRLPQGIQTIRPLRMRVTAVLELHLASIPDLFPSSGLASRLILPVQGPKAVKDGCLEVRRKLGDVLALQRVFIWDRHLSLDEVL